MKICLNVWRLGQVQNVSQSANTNYACSDISNII